MNKQYVRRLIAKEARNELRTIMKNKQSQTLTCDKHTNDSTDSYIIPTSPINYLALLLYYIPGFDVIFWSSKKLQ